MHLLNGFRNAFTCIPVVHEMSAGIAAEHFNETSVSGKAFALVTTGPGLTNILTAVAGCYVEHRELLVIGGQVKSTDLLEPPARQHGFQEIDGVRVADGISVRSARMESPMSKTEFMALARESGHPHPGPVVIEICLDVQGAAVDRAQLDRAEESVAVRSNVANPQTDQFFASLENALSSSSRPVLVIGGVSSRPVIWPALDQLERSGVPVLTTVSAADRIPDCSSVYGGRVGSWGAQRSANLILAQSDLAIVCGAQLDLQQTGFNVDGFAPNAQIFQIFPCEWELAKEKPVLAGALNADPNEVFPRILRCLDWTDHEGWLEYTRKIRKLVPILEPANTARSGFVLSFEFLNNLSRATDPQDLLALASSGASFTGGLQATQIAPRQYLSTSAAFASMGYGLATAIGMSLANPGRRIVLTEGDGGFSQNLQELATIRRHELPIQIFLFVNDGYASIRATQRKFFDGAYVGCDKATGLGFPDWLKLFAAFDIPCRQLGCDETSVESLTEILDSADGPQAYLVPIDPEQSSWPAVASKLLPDGRMESRPIHDLIPPLDEQIARQVTKYLPAE